MDNVKNQGQTPEDPNANLRTPGTVNGETPSELPATETPNETPLNTEIKTSEENIGAENSEGVGSDNQEAQPEQSEA